MDDMLFTYFLTRLRDLYGDPRWQGSSQTFSRRQHFVGKEGTTTKDRRVELPRGQCIGCCIANEQETRWVMKWKIKIVFFTNPH